MRRVGSADPPVPRLHRLLASGAFAFALCFDAAGAQGLFAVNQPWVRPGARATEAYMVLNSTSGATLIGVRSSVAGRASLLGARGRTVPALALPAGRSVTLRPSGERIALARLAHPLKVGERVPLLLTIETAEGTRQEIAVDAEVRNTWPVEAELRAHRH